MQDAHIAIVSVVPTEPAKFDSAVAAANDPTGADTPFAALLGERIDALAPALTGLRDDKASDLPADAADEGEEPRPDATDVPLVLASLPALSDVVRSSPQALGKEGAADAVDSTTTPARLAPAAAAPRAEDLALGKLVADPTSRHAADSARPQAELHTEALRAATESLAAVQFAASPAPAPTPIVPIAPPVHTPEWREAVGERIALFVRDGVQAAELHVNPPELGPVSVRIDVAGSEANVVFGAAHPETRNLLTESLPRLAELLAANGIALAGAQVGGEFQPRREHMEGVATDAERRPQAAAVAAPTVVLRGLIDVFA